MWSIVKQRKLNDDIFLKSAEALVLGQLPQSFGLRLNFVRFMNILQLVYIFIIKSQ